jgi:aspartate/methionine/tyrosine aminotransferase
MRNNGDRRMSIELKQNAEHDLIEKLYSISFDYFKQRTRGGIHAHVLLGRFVAAKEFSLMFLDEKDVSEVVEKAKIEGERRRNILIEKIKRGEYGI